MLFFIHESGIDVRGAGFYENILMNMTGHEALLSGLTFKSGSVIFNQMVDGLTR